MSGKHRIAVRTCGGCFCQFDRRNVIKELSEAFDETCEFKFSYKIDEDKDFDLALQINGCDSECAAPSELIRNLVIDHNNWERATEVFAEETGW